MSVSKKEASALRHRVHWLRWKLSDLLCAEIRRWPDEHPRCILAAELLLLLDNDREAE